LLADDKVVHPYRAPPEGVVELDLPEEATKDGDLSLAFSAPPGGPGARVAEVWLLRR
jgi:hypothetical protein